MKREGDAYYRLTSRLLSSLIYPDLVQTLVEFCPEAKQGAEEMKAVAAMVVGEAKINDNIIVMK